MIKIILRVTMLLQGALWIYFGYQSASVNGGIIVPMLMWLNAALFIGFALLFHRARWMMILTGLFIAGNLLLTVTDQMGVLDYIVLGLNLFTIAAFIFYVLKRTNNN